MKPRKARRVVPEARYLRLANGIQRLLADTIIIRSDIGRLEANVIAQRRALGALTMKLGELGWADKGPSDEEITKIVRQRMRDAMKSQDDAFWRGVFSPLLATECEKKAGVVPIDAAYQLSDVRRYGAIPDPPF